MSDPGKRLPDFLGIGGERCATSWLWKCMKQHPGFYLESKEIRFFNHRFDKGLDYCCEFFRDAREEAVTGEITPTYLRSPIAIERIAEVTPHVKLFAILRDPVERAYSAFRMYRSRGRIACDDFVDALEQHEHLIEGGRYGKQISDVLEYFPRERLLVCHYENVKNNPDKLLGDLFQFLDVDTNVTCTASNETFNASLPKAIQFASERLPRASSVVKSMLGRRGKDAVRKVLGGRPDKKSGYEIDVRAVQLVKSRLSDDTRMLSETLGMDFSHWQSW